MTVQGLLPKNFNPVVMRSETMSKVQTLKEDLCSRIGQNNLTPAMLRIQLLNGGT